MAETSAARGGPRPHPVAGHVARTRREIKAFKLSLKRLNALAERLGLLDPLDVEPAVVYVPQDNGE